MQIDVKQVIIAIGCAALSVSLIGCAGAPAPIQQPSISETVGHNRNSIVPNGAARRNEPQQLWGEPGSRAAAAGALLAKKIFAADY